MARNVLIDLMETNDVVAELRGVKSIRYGIMPE